MDLSTIVKAMGNKHFLALAGMVKYKVRVRSFEETEFGWKIVFEEPNEGRRWTYTEKSSVTLEGEQIAMNGPDGTLVLTGIDRKFLHRALVAYLFSLHCESKNKFNCGSSLGIFKAFVTDVRENIVYIELDGNAMTIPLDDVESVDFTDKYFRLKGKTWICYEMPELGGREIVMQNDVYRLQEVDLVMSTLKRLERRIEAIEARTSL